MQVTKEDPSILEADRELLHINIINAGGSLSRLPSLLPHLHNLESLTFSGGALTELPSDISILLQLQVRWL